MTGQAGVLPNPISGQYSYSQLSVDSHSFQGVVEAIDNALVSAMGDEAIRNTCYTSRSIAEMVLEAALDAIALSQTG